jgi:hypothetical protein
MLILTQILTLIASAYGLAQYWTSDLKIRLPTNMRGALQETSSGTPRWRPPADTVADGGLTSVDRGPPATARTRGRAAGT